MAVEHVGRDNIEAGSGAFQTRTEIVASGQNLKRGDVVGLDSGKLRKFENGVPYHVYGVMFEDVDTTGGEKPGTIFYHGWSLVESEIDPGDGVSIDDVREDLRKLGIILVKGAN